MEKWPTLQHLSLASIDVVHVTASRLILLQLQCKSWGSVVANSVMEGNSVVKAASRTVLSSHQDSLEFVNEGYCFLGLIFQLVGMFISIYSMGFGNNNLV